VLPAALVVAAAVAAHAAALPNRFVWDDEPIVVEDPATKDLGQLPTVLLSPDEVKPYYRPLNRASYLVDYQLFGMSPGGFHLVNLLVHAAGALALYALGLALFARRGPALAAALLLAVHPIHSESVAFVSARNNLFALAFSLVALLLFVHAARRRSMPLAWGSGLAFFLALASKEQGLMVLAVIVALLVLRSTRSLLGGAPRWTVLVPHGVALALYAGLRTAALGGPGGGGAATIWTGLGGRLAQNLYVLPTYLGLSLFPSGLTVFHELPARGWSLWWVPLAWVAILGALALLLRRPSPVATLGLLWLGLQLLTVANIVPIPSASMAERFFHLPAIGLWIVLADVGARLAAGVPARWVTAATASALVALGVRSAVRDRDWRDDVALFESAVAVDPRSPSATFNLGVALKDAGDLDGAARAWRATLALAPDDPGAHAQLGTLAAVQGDLAAAEAHYRAALHVDPALQEALFNLGRICERTGRTAEAVVHYRAAVAAAPTSYGAGIGDRARERLRALDAPAGARPGVASP